MIDEKKIDEAARRYAVYPFNDGLGKERINAFKAGINWFLDNLLHRCGEIPRNDYSQVVLIKENNQALPTILDMNDLMDNSEGNGDYECLWKGIVRTHQIKKWFYLDDLLKGVSNG